VSLVQDLFPGSPAIDAGQRRTCNRQASGKDQRGLARLYDDDGDGDFACDSGAVELQGPLANPGFEQPLDFARDWSLVASGGGDGRVAAATPNGRFAAVLQANGALETLSQAVEAAGDAGDTYALTFLAQGAGYQARMKPVLRSRRRESKWARSGARLRLRSVFRRARVRLDLRVRMPPAEIVAQTASPQMSFAGTCAERPFRGA
jgi:hypothetical protein